MLHISVVFASKNFESIALYVASQACKMNMCVFLNCFLELITTLDGSNRVPCNFCTSVKPIINEGRQLLVVEGDAKVYEVLKFLKYGDELKWVLPIPGDWHLLRNYQYPLMKAFFDAELLVQIM